MSLRRLQRRPIRPYAGDFESEEEPGGFLPPQIPGLQLWLRADKGITLGVGAGVAAWADQSGTGDPNKNVLQNTAVNQPTLNLIDALYGGKPTLSFLSATPQFLKSLTWALSLAAPWTVFMVGNDDGTSAPQIYWQGNNTGNTSYLSVQTNYDWYAGNDVAIGSGSSTPRVLGMVVNGASSRLYNKAKTPVSTGNTGSNGCFGATVGALFNGTDGLNGKGAEVVVYNGDIGSSNINALLAYFGSRYGITIGP